MNLLRCVVEDNNDPKRLGRVRIRVLGIHDPKTKNVRTNELPWSEVLSPLDQGNTFGSSNNIKIGVWGWCIPLNESFTEFLFLGTTKGVYNDPIKTDSEGDEIGFRDFSGNFPLKKGANDNPLTYGSPLTPDITRERIKVESFSEKADTASKAEYPWNKVYQDYEGNLIEVDGTKGNPRIRIQHGTGARIEISKTGDLTLQTSKNGNLWMESKGLIGIKGTGNLIIDSDVRITGGLEVQKEIVSLTNVSDAQNTLSDLAIEYSSHNHIGDNGGSTSTPMPSYSPQPPTFKFKGTPL